MASPRLSGQLGRVVSDRYRLVAPLGEGASAEVFVAEDVQLGREVAVKMLKPALAADRDFLARFRAEARTVAALNHPHVVVVHDWGEDDRPYLVTEYLAGGSLRGALRAGERLSVSQALLVGLQVCRGLAFAHGNGLIHRDLKPANLLFGADGRLRIADFGLARAIAEAAVTEPDGTVVGTARYAAPEQARGERLTEKADVYALALVLVEAVTGRAPFAADTALATLMARVDTDLDVPEELGPLRSVLSRAGRHDPAERPDAAELEISLLAASEQLTAPAPLPLVGALAEADQDGPTPSESTRTMLAPTIDATAVADAPAPSASGSGAATLDGAADEVVPFDEPGPRRRWPLVLAVCALVVAAIGGYVGYQVLRTPTHVIPELAGTSIEDLRVLADRNGWELDEKPTRRTGTEPGEIVSTDPASGVRLAEGELLTVVVSEGNELTAVPADIAGRSLTDVQAEFTAAGLALSITEVHDEDVPAGSVIGFADDPAPSELPEQTAVPILVSDGPAPRTVPDVAGGATYDQVAALLADERLVAAKDEVFSDDVPAGVVMGISPASGTTVARDATVTVTVSKGPELVPVPDLIGMTLDEAQAALEAVGLALGQDCCNSRGRVAETDPAVGTGVPKGTEVDLFLRR